MRPAGPYAARATLLAFLFPPAWAQPGVKRIAGAAATVVAVECVFAPVVASVADASALEVVVSVHWPVFAASADDPALVLSAVSGVPSPAALGACPVAAGIFYPSWHCLCWERQSVPLVEYPLHELRG